MSNFHFVLLDNPFLYSDLMNFTPLIINKKAAPIDGSSFLYNYFNFSSLSTIFNASLVPIATDSNGLGARCTGTNRFSFNH